MGLTRNQRDLLDMAASATFRVCGLSIHGPKEYRTAKSLDRLGLAKLSVLDKLWLTDAGRAALTPAAAVTGE